ncbi:RagB/SusD family nutrient uptake outer membrane protein [Ornithobacterium rhinotracheale]|uniref:RagB/SusD family nutrient uptake outer membrane protein n=1 Tax=Ornithobacterium rhinotracheale TaxID=28251 RepID=UPI004035CFBF
MKKIKLILSGIFVSSVLLTSCLDELDKKPYTQLSREIAFESTNDAKQWVNGMYSSLRGTIYGKNMYATDIQADQLNASIEYGNREGGMHRWAPLQSDDYTIRDIWAAQYQLIANINVAINGIENFKADNAKDEAKLKIMLGELYAGRAYAFHQLVRKYAKPYNPTSAAKDLGLPILTKFDIKELPVRSTMEKTYEKILSDIEVAKKHLAGTTSTPMQNRITIQFVNALEARVKLFKKDWQGAKEAAEKVIDSKVFSLARGKDGLESMFVHDNSPEIIFQAKVSAPDELASTNGVYLGFQGDTQKYVPDFIPTQAIIDLYDDKDARKEVYFKEVTAVLGGNDYKIKVVNKFPGNPTLFTGANTNYQQAPKAFRLAEMYLIAAEASINGAAGADATKYLNELRKARGLEAGSATLEDLKNERTRELAFEGFRLDDLKRWGDNIERKNPQNLNCIMKVPTSEYYELNKKSTDYKTVWAVPSHDITTNNNIVQNEGW